MDFFIKPQASCVEFEIMFHELQQRCSTHICNFGHAVVSGRMEEDSGGGEAVCDKLLVRKRNRFLMCMPEMNYIK